MFFPELCVRFGTLEDFRPDLVIYDAGVDVHEDDDLGNLRLGCIWVCWGLGLRALGCSVGSCLFGERQETSKGGFRNPVATKGCRAGYIFLGVPVTAVIVFMETIM